MNTSVSHEKVDLAQLAGVGNVGGALVRQSVSPEQQALARE